MVACSCACSSWIPPASHAQVVPAIAAVCACPRHPISLWELLVTSGHRSLICHARVVAIRHSRRGRQGQAGLLVTWQSSHNAARELPVVPGPRWRDFRLRVCQHSHPGRLCGRSGIKSCSGCHAQMWSRVVSQCRVLNHNGLQQLPVNICRENNATVIAAKWQHGTCWRAGDVCFGTGCACSRY